MPIGPPHPALRATFPTMWGSHGATRLATFPTMWGSHGATRLATFPTMWESHGATRLATFPTMWGSDLFNLSYGQRETRTPSLD
jgi:hypothetical protein